MTQTFIDHIIILIPYADLISLPTWLTNLFTITPGGQHVDGCTENKLICFADGSYIELISFVNDDPKNRQNSKNGWGNKKFGIVDFAFTTNSDPDVHEKDLNDKLTGQIRYKKPIAGGRKRPDGQEVKWEVTHPLVLERGTVPFFCHDLTERELRAPVKAGNVDHPCGARGVDSLTVIFSKDVAGDIHEAYSCITGEETSSESASKFKVGKVYASEGSGDFEISIKQPSTSDEEKQLKERGVVLSSLGFRGLKNPEDAAQLKRFEFWT